MARAELIGTGDSAEILLIARRRPEHRDGDCGRRGALGREPHGGHRTQQSLGSCGRADGEERKHMYEKAQVENVATGPRYVREECGEGQREKSGRSSLIAEVRGRKRDERGESDPAISDELD